MTKRRFKYNLIIRQNAALDEVSVNLKTGVQVINLAQFKDHPTERRAAQEMLVDFYCREKGLKEIYANR